MSMNRNHNVKEDTKTGEYPNINQFKEDIKYLTRYYVTYLPLKYTAWRAVKNIKRHAKLVKWLGE